MPLLIVRRNPQQVLESLLPSFAVGVRRRAVPLRAWPAAPRPPSRTRRPARPPRTSAARPRRRRPTRRRTAANAIEGGEEHALLRSIVDFGDRLVREVMTPRPDIVAIRSEATLADLRAFFREQEYSRIPVYKDDLDNILGFVFVKDLIKRDDLPATAPVDRRWCAPRTSCRRPSACPNCSRSSSASRCRARSSSTSTAAPPASSRIEDLLEELVGEIRDEYDVESEPISQEADDTFLVSGKVGVDQVSDRLDIEIEGEGFETFGGYLLSHLGRVPARASASTWTTSTSRCWTPTAGASSACASASTCRAHEPS